MTPEVTDNTTGDLRVVMLVPRRADGGWRDDLWRYTSDYWSGLGIDIIEGHHDDGGPFNRGAAINSAARDGGGWDVAVIADGDVIAEYEQVQEAIARTVDTGRVTLAFEKYRALSEAMTRRILDGFVGNWLPGARLKMDNHVSSLVVVPRDLWDRVQGFDERMVGWGADDVAFVAACRVLGGGIERVPGTVWHLWHPESPERDRRRGDYRANHALMTRYMATTDPGDMAALVAEREVPDGVSVVVLTDGRRDCIARTIPAAVANLKGLPVERRVICDDSADKEYHAWLRLQFPDWQLVTAQKRSGFAGAVRRAWNTALGQGQPWVFWLEDDMVIEQPVDLAACAAVLTANPVLSQMVLRRQPWFDPEIAAGGIIEMHPDRYVDREQDGHRWVEHSLGHWTNPHLVSRRFLADHVWPDRSGSERAFSALVMKTYRSAFWGARTDPPTVTHVGERTGTGY